MTKYRRKIITSEMVQTMAEVFQRVCVANKSQMLEINGEPDHVHLMVDLHPDNTFLSFANLSSANEFCSSAEFC